MNNQLTENDPVTINEIDVPITLPLDQAKSLLSDLENNENPTLEIADDDTKQSLIEQIRWQFEHDSPVTRFVSAYNEGEEEAYTEGEGS